MYSSSAKFGGLNMIDAAKKETQVHISGLPLSGNAVFVARVHPSRKTKTEESAAWYGAM